MLVTVARAVGKMAGQWALNRFYIKGGLNHARVIKEEGGDDRDWRWHPDYRARSPRQFDSSGDQRSARGLGDAKRVVRSHPRDHRGRTPVHRGARALRGGMVLLHVLLFIEMKLMHEAVIDRGQNDRGQRQKYNAAE